MPKFSEILFGKNEKIQNISNQNPQQQQLWQQMMSGMNGGEGGYGDIANYYKQLMAGDPASEKAFSDPMMRQFNEDTVPGLAEQFAGMGSGGGMGSSGFRNSAVNAGADLQERLASMRANLRQKGVEGLSGMYDKMMQPTMTPVMRPATGGLVGGMAQGVGQGLGSAAGMGFPGMLKMFSSWKQKGVPNG